MDLVRAKELALEHMAKHGLTAQGWTFEFDRSKTRYGCCQPAKKVIKLSVYLVQLNSEAETTDTILHEIAHALCPRAKGIGWHGPQWKAVAARIGARPERCYDAKTVVQPKYTPRKYDRDRFTAVCGYCHTKVRRSRTPVRMIACGKCCNLYNHGKFDIKYVFTWTDNKTGRVGTTLPKGV